MASTPQTPANARSGGGQVTSPLEQSISHLNQEAARWGETVTEKKAVALGLQNSIHAYQNYLAKVREEPDGTRGAHWTTFSSHVLSCSSTPRWSSS